MPSFGVWIKERERERERERKREKKKCLGFKGDGRNEWWRW